MAQPGASRGRDRDWFAAMLEGSPHITAVVGADARVLYLSPTVVDLMGFDPEVAVGSSLADWVHPDDLPAVTGAFAELVAEPGGVRRVEARLPHAGGEWRWVEAVGHNRLDDARIGAVVIHYRDLSAERSAEERFRTLMESSPDAIVVFDRTHRVTFANSTALALARPVDLDLVGFRLPDIPVVRQAIVEVETALRAVLEAGETTEREIMLELGSRVRWFHVSYAPVLGPDGGVESVLSVARDTTRHKEREARLAHRALHDELTGLPNRVLLFDRLSQLLARTARAGTMAAVLFVDLDGLKTVNDTLGHAAGDELLQAVAARLDAASRPADTVGRFGGDEFVVCCEVADERAADEVAGRVWAELRHPVPVQGREVEATASVGVALGSAGEVAAAELIARADRAMYEAKRAGGGEIRRFGSPGPARQAGAET
ncbi:MAG: sensor domain-containing diguanylate cyclase [Acidimicrobiia bacterium]|nr:sensor domain-containing diguanylate cyclase [Acidimicrobiia bacterium]